MKNLQIDFKNALVEIVSTVTVDTYGVMGKQILKQDLYAILNMRLTLRTEPR
jgi:hypothetical protein